MTYKLWVTVETVTDEGREGCDFPQGVAEFESSDDARSFLRRLREQADYILNRELTEATDEKPETPYHEVLIVIEKHTPDDKDEYEDVERDVVAVAENDEKNRAYDAMIALSGIGIKWL